MKYPLILTLFLSLSVAAQESARKTGLQKMIQPKASYAINYIDEAGFDGYGGKVSVVKNRLSLNNKIAGISYTNWKFHWSDIAKLPFGDKKHTPIAQMHSLRVNANLPYFISDKWFMLTSVSLKSTFEQEMQDSYSFGILSFASYKLTNEHAFAIGAFANYHPISTFAMPAFSYSYRARAQDGFKFILGYPRTYIGYHLSNEFLLRFGMIFSQSVIRLSDQSTISKSGFVEAKDYLSNFGLSYTLGKNFSFESDIIYTLKREFTLYTKEAQMIDSYSIQPSFGINFKLTYLF